MKRILLTTFIVFSLVQLSAQGQVDICLTKAEDHWDCILKAPIKFQGIATNIQFTIVLPVGQAGIDKITQDDEIAKYLPISLVGKPIVGDSSVYQKITGFGFVTLDSLNPNRSEFQWILLGKIYLTERNTIISIENNTWTESNNGNFYMEINGEDKTGNITTDCPTIFAKEINPFIWKVFPNPLGTDNNFTHLFSAAKSKVTLELVDLFGRRIWIRDEELSPDHPLVLNFKGYSSGLYLLKIDHGNGTSALKVLKK